MGKAGLSGPAKRGGDGMIKSIIPDVLKLRGSLAVVLLFELPPCYMSAAIMGFQYH